MWSSSGPYWTSDRIVASRRAWRVGSATQPKGETPGRLGRLVNAAILADTFGLHPLYWLEQEGLLGTGAVRALVLGVAALAAVLFAALPRRSARFALPALVGCVFLASQIAVFDVVRSYSRTLEDVARTGAPSWLDDRVGRARAPGVLWAGGPD